MLRLILIGILDVFLIVYIMQNIEHYGLPLGLVIGLTLVLSYIIGNTDRYNRD